VRPVRLCLHRALPIAAQFVYLAGDHQDRLILGGEVPLYVVQDIGDGGRPARKLLSDIADARSRVEFALNFVFQRHCRQYTQRAPRRKEMWMQKW
jgi:hypothetical protein